VGSYLSDAALFLVDTILGIYILLILLRFLLQLARADFYNPVSQFIVRATNPPLVRLRRFIPGLFGIDLAALVLLIAMEALRIFLSGYLLGESSKPLGIFFLSIGELAKLTIHVLIFAIFIRALLSWFSNGLHHPMAALLHSFTEPILKPARQLIPRAIGIDFAPFFVFLILMLVLKLVVNPVVNLGLEFLN